MQLITACLPKVIGQFHNEIGLCAANMELPAPFSSGFPETIPVIS